MSLTAVMEPMRRLAARIDNLPALPRITTQLLEALDDPDTSAADLSTLISTDQALAMRLLKSANSAYYGFPRRIGTVNLAVVVLGFETVRDLCLSIIIADGFYNVKDKVPLDMDATWRHSLASAIACRLILRQGGINLPGEGFIAGLVHDVGKLFLARYFPEEYQQTIQKINAEAMPLLQAEREVFDVTHALAGAWLLEEWNLPAWLVRCVRDHHGAQNGDEPDFLTQAVTFADLLAHRANFSAGPFVPTEITPHMIAHLRLRTDSTGVVDLDLYFDKLSNQLRRAEDLLNVMRAPVPPRPARSLRASP